MLANPQKEHEWLHRLVGEWAYTSEASMGPDAPPHRGKGTESVRSIGGLWILCEGSGEMPGGGTATMLITLGYDPASQRFVGTWIGSMMTHLWTYDGWRDESGNVLTLESEGPGFDEGKLAKFRDVIEVRSDDHRIFTAHVQEADGSWRQFMSSDYRRLK